jgi:hypothetical protein
MARSRYHFTEYNRPHFLRRRDSAWERHRDKTCAIEQGMRQRSGLLTGRVRLVCVSSHREAAKGVTPQSGVTRACVTSFQDRRCAQWARNQA